MIFNIYDNLLFLIFKNCFIQLEIFFLNNKMSKYFFYNFQCWKLYLLKFKFFICLLKNLK